MRPSCRGEANEGRLMQGCSLSPFGLRLDTMCQGSAVTGFVSIWERSRRTPHVFILPFPEVQVISQHPLIVIKKGSGLH